MIEILHKAINTYGEDKQLLMLVEEMAELLVAITHKLRGRVEVEYITEEIADVYIMLEQAKIIFGISSDDINEQIDFKIKRLEKRMGEDKNE